MEEEERRQQQEEEERQRKLRVERIIAEAWAQLPLDNSSDSDTETTTSTARPYRPSKSIASRPIVLGVNCTVSSPIRISSSPDIDVKLEDNGFHTAKKPTIPPRTCAVVPAHLNTTSPPAHPILIPYPTPISPAMTKSSAESTTSPPFSFPSPEDNESDYEEVKFKSKRSPASKKRKMKRAQTDRSRSARMKSHSYIPPPSPF